MKTRLLAAAALAAVPLHAACAQDPEPEASVRDPLAVSGFRAELQAGYDDDGFSNGTLYGGRIGYDLAVGRRVLLGADAELNDVTTHRDLGLPTQPALRAKDGRELYLGARATFVLSRRFRLFGGAGYTRQRQGFFFETSPTPPPIGTFGVERIVFDGYRLSAGAQFLLGKRAFLGAEYRYANYEDFGNRREQLVGSLGFRF
jgi:outer membrane immunogenic protein